MLTVEKLKEYGADVKTGLSRCMNNEAFYFRLIGMAVKEPSVAALGEALDAGDLKKAFEEAHKLKGVMGNLSLTPVFEPASKLTELLRAETAGDYAALYKEIVKNVEALRAMLD